MLVDFFPLCLIIIHKDANVPSYTAFLLLF